MGSRILVVGPAWVGDMVMAQGLFRHLKSLHPNCQLDVIAPSWTKLLLARMPEVNSSHALPIGHGQLKLIKRYLIGKSLKKKNYTQAYVLPNSFKSALIPFFANIQYRVGWLGEMRHGVLTHPRKLNPKKYPKMIERFIALAFPEDTPLPEELLLPSLQVDKNQALQLSEKLNINLDLPVIIIAPGAEFGAAKKWPTKYYKQVAEYVINKGFQVWLLGSSNDYNDAKYIYDRLSNPKVINLVGKTSLADAIDLISLADKIICNDSGLMHIASALNKFTVTPFGSTSTEFTPPLGKFAKTVERDLWCRPCFKRECPYEHLSCLNNLLPKMVIDALEIS